MANEGWNKMTPERLAQIAAEEAMEDAGVPNEYVETDDPGPQAIVEAADAPDTQGTQGTLPDEPPDRLEGTVEDTGMRPIESKPEAPKTKAERQAAKEEQWRAADKERLALAVKGRGQTRPIDPEFKKLLERGKKKTETTPAIREIQRRSLMAFAADSYSKPLGSSPELIGRAKGVKGARLTSRPHSVPIPSGPALEGSPSTSFAGLLPTLYEGVGEQHLPKTPHLLSFYQQGAPGREIEYQTQVYEPGQEPRLEARKRMIPVPASSPSLGAGWPFETRPGDAASLAAMMGENQAVLNDPAFRSLLNELRANAGQPGEAGIRQRMARIVGQSRTKGITADLLEWASRWESALKSYPSPVVVQQAAMDLRARAQALMSTNAQAGQDLITAGQKLLSSAAVMPERTAAAIQAGGAGLESIGPGDVLPTAPLLAPQVTEAPGIGGRETRASRRAFRVPATDLAEQAGAATRLGQSSAPILDDVRRALQLALEVEQVPATGGLAASERFRYPGILTNLVKESRRSIPAPGTAAPTGENLIAAALEQELIKAVPGLPAHLQVQVLGDLVKAGYIPEEVYLPVPGQRFQGLDAAGYRKALAAKTNKTRIDPNTVLYTDPGEAGQAASAVTRKMLIEELARASKRKGAVRLGLAGEKGARTLAVMERDPLSDKKLERLLDLLVQTKENRAPGLLQQYDARINAVMQNLEEKEGSLRGLFPVLEKLAAAKEQKTAEASKLEALLAQEGMIEPEDLDRPVEPSWRLRARATGEKLSGFQEEVTRSPTSTSQATLRRLEKRIASLTKTAEHLPRSWTEEAYRLDQERTRLRRIYEGLQAVAGTADPAERETLFKTLVQAVLPRNEGVSGGPGTRAPKPKSEYGRLTKQSESLMRRLSTWLEEKAQNQSPDAIASMIDTVLEESGRGGLASLGKQLPHRAAVMPVKTSSVLGNLLPEAVVQLLQGGARGQNVSGGRALLAKQTSRLSSEVAGKAVPSRLSKAVKAGKMSMGPGPLMLLLPLLLNQMFSGGGDEDTA